MPSLLGALKGNLAYFFILVGVAWAAVTVLAGSYLLLWPALTSLAAGVFLKVFPGTKFTWAWGVSAATLGVLVGLDQIHAWYSYIGGTFTAIAGEAIGVFGVLMVVHGVLLYLGWARPEAPKSAQT